MPFPTVTLDVQKPQNSEYPANPQTIGDHIKKKRMDLALFQKDVAQLIGTNTSTVTNWEKGHSEPVIRLMPAIIELLGYIPFEVAQSQGDQLIAYRRIRGISKERLAEELKVDITTLLRWERGVTPKKLEHRELIDGIANRLIEELGLMVYAGSIVADQNPNSDCY